MDGLELRRRVMMERGADLRFVTAIKFDGQSWVDTGYKLPSLASMWVSVGNETILPGQAQYFFSNWDGTSGTGAFLGGATTTSRRQNVVSYDSEGWIKDDTSLGYDYSAYSFFLTPYRFGWGSYGDPTFSRGSTPSTGSLIFGRQGNSPLYFYTGTMKSFYVYDSSAQNARNQTELANNYTPVATFKPCVYGGRAGFWFEEERRFCGNGNPNGNLTAIE